MTDNNSYPANQPQPGICPGCGRCQTCGQPTPQPLPLQPYWGGMQPFNNDLVTWSYTNGQAS